MANASPATAVTIRVWRNGILITDLLGFILRVPRRGEELFAPVLLCLENWNELLSSQQ